MRYLVRRATTFVLTLSAAITLNFVILRLMPGSPADAALAKFAGAIPSATLAFVGDAAYHSVLPAITIIISVLGGWVLSMRNNMIGALGSDYVTFAEANGLPPRTVALRCAARNAQGPTRDVLMAPSHPYTRQLLAALPSKFAAGGYGSPAGPGDTPGTQSDQPPRPPQGGSS